MIIRSLSLFSCNWITGCYTATDGRCNKFKYLILGGACSARDLTKNPEFTIIQIVLLVSQWEQRIQDM
jgi:hypothetical protein